MYLLSIVIPTRNRQEYCLKAVSQILSVTDESVQIVITDNSDENSLSYKIQALHSSRIKFEFISKRIPGVDNYARGIELSDGEYVCCIGDDDGVLRNIIDVVVWMKENKIDAIKPGVQATYFWPGSAKEYASGCVGLLSVSNNVYLVNPENELVNFLKSGIIDFPNAKLVKAYHGIVKRELFNQIKNKTGRFCGGLSPDIYLSVSLSTIVDKLVCIDVPVTIFGACRASTTADSVNKINTGRLENAPHFVGQPYEWSSLVPRYYCGSNIWADSALHALSDMKRADLLNYFNLARFSGYSLVYCGKFKNEIMENYRRNNGNLKDLEMERKSCLLPYKISRFKDFIRRKKYIISILRKIRACRVKKTGKENFVKNNVKDVFVAEQLVSSVVLTHMNSVLQSLNDLVKIS